jgi:fluoroacetyl-CoA thioesterase
MTESIRAGMRIEAEQEVTQDRVAAHLGSGSLQVYATPAMVTFIEHTCRALIEPLLPPGQTTVGTFIELEHMAPTPLGAQVRIEASVIEVEGRRVAFQAQVWDAEEQIGQARHDRFIIDEARFLERVQRESGAAFD